MDAGHLQPILSDVSLASDAVAERWSQAVGYEGERLLVIGGAGTGKSTMIVARFAALVQRGVRLERIAVATPAPARARRLRAELERGLQRGYERLVVGTPVALAELVLATEAPGEEALGPE